MASSGTYTNAPEIADLTDEAFERCGIDPATLTARHLRSARRSLDYLMIEWANKGIHLWAVESKTTDMIASTASYVTETNIITPLEVVIRRSGLDTPVFPMTRDQYHAIPDKTIEGMPTNYWFDRDASTPTLYLWPVPDTATDDLIYYYLRRLQDTGTAAGTPDIPYRWYEAMVSGLAAKLSEKFAPDRENFLRNKAGARYKEADVEDRERAPTTFKVRY